MHTFPCEEDAIGWLTDNGFEDPESDNPDAEWLHPDGRAALIETGDGVVKLTIRETA